LKKHAETLKHKRVAEPFSSSRQQKIPFPTQKVDLESKRAQAGLVLFIAAHCSILSIDHLTPLCKNIFNTSNAAKELNLSRTKCTALIKNVIGPHFLSTLIADINESYYSLIIDESTDITVLKKLGVVVRYFSVTKKQVISTFLGLVTISDGTANSIVDSLEKLLVEVKLKKK
jgi:hypothetical protein